MEKELQELGLSKNESAIYLFLLKHGESTSGPIIKGTRIANSRVYESINNLLAKGLITYNMQKNGKHFNAVNPSKLKELEEERMRKVEFLLPSLRQMISKEKSNTLTAIYEGFEGFKTAFNRIIEDCPEKETIYIIGFSEQPYANESLRTFLANMNLKSAKKKQNLKILMDAKSKPTLGRDRKKEKFTRVRYMPQGYISPIAVDVFQDYTYMFLWEEKPFVFMIKNSQIAQSFKQYFNFLWNLAKE